MNGMGKSDAYRPAMKAEMTAVVGDENIVRPARKMKVKTLKVMTANITGCVGWGVSAPF